MKTKQSLLFALMLTLLSGSLWANEKIYTIDRSHSNVSFTVKHMVVTTVRGQFNEFQGSVTFDPDNPMAFAAEGTIQANSVDTNHERRDNDLRSDNFFDVEKYPEIRFMTNKVVKKDGGLVAVGELTIKDVTKEVEIPFEVTGPIANRRGDRIGVNATLTIKRKDYNILWNRTLDSGDLVVSNEVKIELNLAAVNRPPREGNN